jgi:EAL domain-containing protein (putative c-di-GMP-specific phosphodiesterase class I)
LELEITESLLLRDEAKTHGLLHKLRSLGVKFALDDFGTAYASLSYLRSFPFDKIKIDRTFIADLNRPKRKDCIAIIQAVEAPRLCPGHLKFISFMKLTNRTYWLF